MVTPTRHPRGRLSLCYPMLGGRPWLPVGLPDLFPSSSSSPPPHRLVQPRPRVASWRVCCWPRTCPQGVCHDCAAAQDWDHRPTSQILLLLPAPPFQAGPVCVWNCVRDDVGLHPHRASLLEAHAPQRTASTSASKNDGHRGRVELG